MGDQLWVIEVFGTALEVEVSSFSTDREVLRHISTRAWHLGVTALLGLQVDLLVVLSADAKGIQAPLRHFAEWIEV